MARRRLSDGRTAIGSITPERGEAKSGGLALSFGGSGLMMMYQFGVAREISRDLDFMQGVQKVHGTSGGAICGAMLVACPERFDDAMKYFESGAWLREATPRDVLEPHKRILRRAMEELGLETSAEALKLGGFVAHATRLRNRNDQQRSKRTFFQNVSIDDFANDAEVLEAIAASCCLSPNGVSFRGTRLYDGGFSDPLPSDPVLETVAVSILNGTHVDLAPDYSQRATLQKKQQLIKKRYKGPPFLRYALSPQNARALLETTFLTSKRARARYDQGQRDAQTFLDTWHTKKRNNQDDTTPLVTSTVDDHNNL